MKYLHACRLSMKKGTLVPPDTIVKCPGCGQIWLDKMQEFECICSRWHKNPDGWWEIVNDLTDSPSPTARP